jgi:hypothetical protein
MPKSNRDSAHLVTEARRSHTEDIAYRERRYLVMMAIRMACFGIAVALFVVGAGWIAAIPAVGAIFIPYFAVVFANGGREPAGRSGFRPYEPNLPVPYSPPEQGSPGVPGSTHSSQGDASRPGSRPTEDAS